MQWLSQKNEALSEQYEVVIVGSGYGGAVAASLLAREGLNVCVLERGREIVPGEYPNNPEKFLKEVQLDLRSGHYGPLTGLFDIRCNKEMNLLIGCGLGGSSLIDAGVCMRPDPAVFQDLTWPDAIRNDVNMERYYQRAEAMLRPARYKTPRAAFVSAPVNINFDPLQNGLNASGVQQNPCVHCGDCLTGCNYGAKNTLLMNYIPDAKRHGAQLFTRTRVSHIEQDGAAWKVFFKNGKGKRGKEFDTIVTANIVILAAGSLGTTEILLRSGQKGLRLSPALGDRFSGNGNMIGLAFNTNVPMNAVGFGSNAFRDKNPVGTSTTGLMDMRMGRDLQNGMVISDATLPGAVSKWLPVLLSSMAKKMGNKKEDGVKGASRIIQSKIRGPYMGAIHHTQMLLVVSHDNSGGELIMEKDRVRLFWPGVSQQPEFYRANEIMRQMTKQWGGDYIPNPIWDEVLGHGLMSWNPLGGAVMADDAQHGVVNHKGQVYASDRGLAVHAGLYVMDGSVIPRSLGVGPLLTIAALAERSCEQFISARKI